LGGEGAGLEFCINANSICNRSGRAGIRMRIRIPVRIRIRIRIRIRARAGQHSNSNLVARKYLFNFYANSCTHTDADANADWHPDMQSGMCVSAYMEIQIQIQIQMQIQTHINTGAVTAYLLDTHSSKANIFTLASPPPCVFFLLAQHLCLHSIRLPEKYIQKTHTFGWIRFGTLLCCVLCTPFAVATQGSGGLWTAKCICLLRRSCN